MSAIQSIVDSRYKGKMPLAMYKGFLKVISNPELKAYFIRNFKPSSYIPDTPPVVTPKKKKKNLADSTIEDKTISSSNSTLADESKRQSSYQSIFTVKATDFSCQHTVAGSHLVFRSHKAFCLVKSEWFQPRVLKSIDRTFKIRLSDYIGFTFIPHSDKQVFLNLLQKTYLDVEQQIYNEQLTFCLNSIEKYINDCVYKYLYKCRNIKFETNLDDYSFNEDKQIYIYKFNAVKHLNIKTDGVRIHVPLSWILKKLDEANCNKFHKVITSKYQDGYTIVADLDTIFPNHTSLDITIVIPKIFVARFGKDKPIELKAEYSSNLGYFKVGISSYIPGYRYQTAISNVIFSDEIKDSLINIMRNIDSRFIITFYSAFVSMFNEGDSIIQSNYEKQLESLKHQNDDDFIYLTLYDYYRYISGYSPLLPFDIENNSDWMWLTAQMKDGVFLNAFAFRDKDETYSSKIGDTVKYFVKVYLTVKDASYSYKNYLGKHVRVEKIIISMYALDTTKSIYRFEVKKDKINEAIFFIWSYFSSNNYNKRQDFDYILSLKHNFGIIHFYKDSPLDYRSGIGYCDRKWLTDI